MANLARRIEKERLEKDLAARQKDYEGVANKLRWETNPVEQNSLQAKVDKLIDEIEQIEQKLDKIKTSSQGEIIKILQPYYFNEEKLQIQKAYRLSLPERLIDEELPSSLESLIGNLQWPQQEENYSFLEKFVGNLLLNQDLRNELKQELNKWAEENIKNCCPLLLVQLKQEQQQRWQQCYPGLLVAISEREGSYVVEAWLIKNIAQYQQYASSDCEQLTINKQAEIPTDETLKNVPELLKNLIAQSFDKCQKYLKQIHIFLPSKFMNYAVDWWQNWQNNGEGCDNYSTTIGEDYEVLLRCSERLRGKSPPVIKWRDKANILRTKLSHPAGQIFVLGNSNNPKSLFKQLKLDEQAIAVKITAVFQQKEPGTLLWQAAVPLALWIRQQLPQISNQLVLDELLKDCLLQALPNQVKSKRVDALDWEHPESHVGRHLCLLWDDPNLLPPEQLLTPNNL
jgi:hypothetical protein